MGDGYENEQNKFADNPMTDPTNPPDYTKLAGQYLLDQLRDDARKWAVAFNQHAVRLGYHGMDECWLTTWFANAIENSSDIRYRRALANHPASGT